MALFLSVGFSFTQYYSDDFQTYGTAQDPAFVQKYLTNFTLNNPVYNPWIQSIVQSPSDSLTWKILYNTGGQMVSTNFMTAYNYSIISTSKPFTFSQVIRPDSQIIVEGNGNTMEWYFYLFENTSANYNAKSIVEKLNTTKGYLLTIQFPYSLSGTDPIHVMLSRCATGLTAPNVGKWSCSQVLGTTSSIIASNNTGMTSYYSSGGLHGRVQYNVISPMRMKVVVENDNTIRFFMNNNSYIDIERFSYLDTAPLFNFTGGLIQGIAYDASNSNSYQTDNVKLYVDDLSYLNYSYTTAFGNTTLTQVSYPAYAPNQISLVDRMNGSLASWIASNQRFAFQYSFNTPAGLMNPLTELTCPVKMIGEYACEMRVGQLYCGAYSEIIPDGHDNPQVELKATTANDANKCVIIDEYSTAELQNYGWLCYAPQSCLISYSAKEQVKQTYIQPITTSYTASGQWKNLYKILDTNGKLLYASTDIACSAPANISVLLTYVDIKSCAGLGGIGNSTYYAKEYNITIGIDPTSGQPCDYQLNSSCWNGSLGTPSVPPFFNGTKIPSLENYTTPTGPTPASDAGITNIYDSSQSGGIIDMILSPAFLGMMVCVIVGSAVGYVAGPLVGVCGFIGAIIIATGFGLFPIWISFGIVALTAFATAMLVKAGFTS